MNQDSCFWDKFCMTITLWIKFLFILWMHIGIVAMIIEFKFRFDYYLNLNLEQIIKFALFWDWYRFSVLCGNFCFICVDYSWATFRMIIQFMEIWLPCKILWEINCAAIYILSVYVKYKIQFWLFSQFSWITVYFDLHVHWSHVKDLCYLVQICDIMYDLLAILYTRFVCFQIFGKWLIKDFDMNLIWLKIIIFLIFFKSNI
jgi:hypothetical protein